MQTMPKVCESPREWRSSWESNNSWADEDHCLQGSLPAGIAVSEDRWGENSHCGNCRCARGYRPCVHAHALSHLEVCGKNRVSMCCRTLCGWGYSTWMLQDDRTDYILQQTSLLHEKCRVKPRGQESKNIPNKNKTKSKFLFTVI